ASWNSNLIGVGQLQFPTGGTGTSLADIRFRELLRCSLVGGNFHGVLLIRDSFWKPEIQAGRIRRCGNADELHTKLLSYGCRDFEGQNDRKWLANLSSAQRRRHHRRLNRDAIRCLDAFERDCTSVKSTPVIAAQPFGYDSIGWIPAYKF